MMCFTATTFHILSALRALDRFRLSASMCGDSGGGMLVQVVGALVLAKKWEPPVSVTSIGLAQPTTGRSIALVGKRRLEVPHAVPHPHTLPRLIDRSLVGGREVP